MAIGLTKQLLYDDEKIILFCVKCGKELFVDRLYDDSRSVSKIISTCSKCSSNKDTEIHLDKYGDIITKKPKRVDREDIHRSDCHTYNEKIFNIDHFNLIDNSMDSYFINIPFGSSATSTFINFNIDEDYE